MTDINIAELRAIAKAATPGAWFAKANDLIGGWCVGTCEEPPSECADFGSSNVADFANEADATYFAKFDPKLTGALLDKLERYGAALAEIKTCITLNSVATLLPHLREVVRKALNSTEANDD